MNADRMLSKVDSITAAFVTMFLFFQALVLTFCACLPSHMLTTPKLIASGFSHWTVRVALLTGAGFMVFGGTLGRSFGAPRSHRKVLEEIRTSLAALASASVVPTVEGSAPKESEEKL